MRQSWHRRAVRKKKLYSLPLVAHLHSDIGQAVGAVCSRGRDVSGRRTGMTHVIDDFIVAATSALRLPC